MPALQSEGTGSTTVCRGVETESDHVSVIHEAAEGDAENVIETTVLHPMEGTKV